MSKENNHVIKNAVRLIWNDIKNMKLAILVIAGYLWFNRNFLGSSCIWVRITGFPCPGCGMTRAAVALLKGDFKRAFEIHPFIYPIAILFFFFCVYRYILQKSQKVFVKWMIAVVIGMIVFYIYRMACVFPGEPPMSYYHNNLIQRILNTFSK